MEFLARSWSTFALQVSKALEKQQGEPKRQCNVEGEEAKQWPHFICGSSHWAVDSILAGSVFQRQSKGKTVGSCQIDKKAKRKEEHRVQDVKIHEVISVGVVDAVVAAIAAAATHDHNKNADEEEFEKRIAVASAVALVARCVEMAMCMGADRHKMASLIGSAVNVKTPGEIITLTAGAATALRGAPTFRVSCSSVFFGDFSSGVEVKDLWVDLSGMLVTPLFSVINNVD